ncbi:transcription factor [Aspergillus hancockii]|nr:transcription factor [Aspergillus hancockii]
MPGWMVDLAARDRGELTLRNTATGAIGRRRRRRQRAGRKKNSLSQFCGDSHNLTAGEFYRKTSQKPNEELIQEFRKGFPHVFSELSITPAPNPPGTGHVDPVAPNDLRWDTTLAHTNSLNLMPPITQPQGLYTRLPGQMCAVLHSPAGDLHTPTVEWNLASSPLLWTQMVSAQAPRHPDEPVTSTLDPIPPVDSSQFFPNMDPFGPELTASPTTTLFWDRREYVAPDDCDQKDRYFETARELSSDHSGSLPPNVTEQLPLKPDTPFRYHVTLHTPTAMFDASREIPITYLNKSQAYSMTVVDTSPPAPIAHPAQYRTRIGISFEEAAHRASPAPCWQLWHDARGSSDARQRGGRPCAVEFVGFKHRGRETQNGPRYLESSSFNRFSVVWTAGADGGPSECEILVRFHFLSTDFTQSKGVKGVPVRLCAKTEMISPQPPQQELGPQAEICYCRVKVFRDHGAERKQANDIEHIKKSIQRVEKQINRSECEGSANGKRQKRRKNTAPPGLGSGSAGNDPLGTMSRSVSRSSSVSTPGDLYRLLYNLHTRFTSALPVSVLSLPGDEDHNIDQLAISPTLGAPTLTQSERTDSRSDANVDECSESSVRGLPSRPSITHAKTTSVDPQHVACFYINIQRDDRPHDYYHAVYLTQRRVGDLVSQLSQHAKVCSESITRVVHVTQKGLKILVDDDVVEHITEGQDMIARFVEIPVLNCGEDDAPEPPSFEVQLMY